MAFRGLLSNLLGLRPLDFLHESIMLPNKHPWDMKSYVDTWTNLPMNDWDGKGETSIIGLQFHHTTQASQTLSRQAPQPQSYANKQSEGPEALGRNHTLYCRQQIKLHGRTYLRVPESSVPSSVPDLPMAGWPVEPWGTSL